MSQPAALLQELIQGGNDIQATKYFEISIVALVFYDYALTLEDEIRYVWGGQKKWMFYLFILNRYIPMAYKIWVAIGDFWPGYTVELCSRLAFLQPIFFIWSTLSAQIFLMVRVYVLNGQNKIVLWGFISMSVVQALTGILLTAITTNAIAKLPAIPLDAFRICVFIGRKGYEVTYVSISVLYDTVAFALIVRRSRGEVSAIIRKIVEDATVYFLMIFTSHILLCSFVLFARESLRFIPSVGTIVIIPIMVTRLILSLRKASQPRRVAQWNIDHFTRGYTNTTMTMTRDHYAPSGMQEPATRRASNIETADPGLELSDFGSQDNRHPGALDGEI